METNSKGRIDMNSIKYLSFPALPPSDYERIIVPSGAWFSVVISKIME